MSPMMDPMRIVFLLPVLFLVFLTACSTAEPQYWQRTSASSQIYTQGPKAQHMLNRDLSQCVLEMKELERLGTLRNAGPVLDSNWRLKDPDQRKMSDYVDRPEYDGYLRAELLDYHDFDSCMEAHGWDRTKYVPFEVADRSRKNYLKAIHGENYQSKTGQYHDQNTPDKAEYGRLNE
jgi:hypothetical protein